MKAQGHSTPVASPVATEDGKTASISVDYRHPLLQLNRALPWEARRGHDQQVGRSGQKRRWRSWAALGCLVVWGFGGLDGGQEFQLTANRSVGG
jgi:hypothetical protein